MPANAVRGGVRSNSIVPSRKLAFGSCAIPFTRSMPSALRLAARGSVASVTTHLGVAKSGAWARAVAAPSMAVVSQTIVPSRRRCRVRACIRVDPRFFAVMGQRHSARDPDWRREAFGQAVSHPTYSDVSPLDRLPPIVPPMRTSLGPIAALPAGATGMSFAPTPACYHGGAFFEAIGEEFDALSRLATVINADVLDAWFPPSPRVLDAIQAHLPLLVRTSPPAACAGLVRAIARVRGVEPANVLPGGGSSDLIFLALTNWLTPSSRV